MGIVRRLLGVFHFGRNRVLTFTVKRVWHSIGSGTSQQHFSTISEVDLFIEKHLAFQVNSLTIFDELTMQSFSEKSYYVLVKPSQETGVPHCKIGEMEDESKITTIIVFFGPDDAEPAPNCTTPSSSWPLAGRVQAALRKEVGIFVTFSFIALLILSPLWTSDAALVPQLLAVSSTNFQSVAWLGGLAGLVATRSAVKIQDLVEDGSAPGWFSRNFYLVGWEVGS